MLGRSLLSLAFFAVRIGRDHWEALVAHAAESVPNECCGYLRARDGIVEETYRAENLRSSPYGYELDGKSLLAANKLDDQGFQVGIYHSHPRSAAEPWQTDINLAQYPHCVYSLVSLTGTPEVRA